MFIWGQHPRPISQTEREAQGATRAAAPAVELWIESFFSTQAASLLLSQSWSQENLRLEQKQNQLSLSSLPSFRGSWGSSLASLCGGAFGRRPWRNRASICSLWTFNILGRFPQSKVEPRPWAGCSSLTDAQGLCTVCVPGRSSPSPEEPRTRSRSGSFCVSVA